MDSRSNTTEAAPAASGQTPCGALLDLEDFVWRAALSADLADYVASHAIGDIDVAKGSRLTAYEADLLLFATLQAKNAASEARDMFREAFKAVQAMEARP